MRDITPIVDLCHFGVPDWLGNFQNPDFPHLFANYARAFAERFRWVQLYPPVNEMFICATFSASYGWWNEQLSSDQAFVTALKHLVKANVLAMQAILEVRPDAIFVQSESSDCIMGNDYFVTNEHRVFEDGRTIAAGEIFGYDEHHTEPSPEAPATAPSTSDGGH